MQCANIYGVTSIMTGMSPHLLKIVRLQWFKLLLNMGNVMMSKAHKAAIFSDLRVHWGETENEVNKYSLRE